MVSKLSYYIAEKCTMLFAGNFGGIIIFHFSVKFSGKKKPVSDFGQ